MQNIDTLLLPRWMVPIEPHNTYYENYALAINKGKIIALLPHNEAKQHFDAKQIIELPHHVLMPGLINGHTHSPMTLFRGLADDLPLMDWLNDYIWPAEKKWMSDDFIRDGTELAIIEMLKSGTTCFNENFFFSDVIAETVAKTTMRACIGITLVEFTTPWAKAAPEYFAKAIPIIERFNKHPHLQISLAPHSPYATSDETLIRTKQLAEKYDINIHMHMHETAAEITLGLEQYNKRPLQRVYELGLLSSNFQAIHMTQVTEEDMKILEKTNIHVVHCPESNMKLASGFCPVQQMLAAGINVALGTDGAASNNDLDMFGEMRSAAFLGKVVANNPSATPAPEVLRMATLNGAKAMGIADQVGSLEVGKDADVIAVDLSGAATTPIYNPISHLVYVVNRNQVSDVWIAGEQLVRSGQTTVLDEKEVFAKANLWAKRIKTTTCENVS